jgi:cyanophycin synthetase
MDIQQILVLRGPNVWANFPVIEVTVDLRPDLDVPSKTFPGFNDRLKNWLPSMIEHRCGLGFRGGFFQRLDDGTYLGHILEHSSLEIQSLVGPLVGFGRARETTTAGVYRVAIEYAEERLGLACVQMAIRMLTAARTGEPFDIELELATLRKQAEEDCFGPSTQAIVSAAVKRTIPWIRLANNSLVQLGYGRAQRRIWTAETDQTSAIAESIAQDKELTRTLLRQSGVPVPEGRVVSSAEEAWRAAQELGLPVVVKPREGNYGRGVSIDLRDQLSVLRAFNVANAEKEGVIVEQCIQGLHHRLLVVGDKFIAAAQGDADHVIGDGQHSIRELVDIDNQHPNRGDPQTHPLARIELDQIALDLLGRNDMTPSTVPLAGQRVILHYNGDLPNDVTPLVHPEVARVAVLAAKTVGLNIAGIDMVLTDISCPVEEQHGAVLEVNASPSLIMHVKPLRGEPQPVGEAIVEQLFPSGVTGRVPVVAVSGTNGKSAAIALLERFIGSQNPSAVIGIASSDGLSVGKRVLKPGCATDYDNVARLFVNPLVDFALVEMEPSTVLRQGIPFDHCQVAIVTNLGSSDHLGVPYMTRERMILVERCGVDMVLPEGTAVLNADEPEVLEMAAKCPGKVLLISRDGERSELATHRANGGRTVTIGNHRIRFEEGTTCLAEWELPIVLASYSVTNLLSALGGAWSLGLEPAQLVEILREPTFQKELQGFRLQRTRKLDVEDRRIFITLARNPSAVEEAIRDVDGQGPFARRIAIQTFLPKDWRDEDAFTVGSILAKHFDEVRLQVETPLANENVPSSDARNGHPEPPLVSAFAEGVRSQNHAQFAMSATDNRAPWSFGLSATKPGDLLFVQVGNPEFAASFSPAKEGSSSKASNSTATDIHQLGGS